MNPQPDSAKLEDYWLQYKSEVLDSEGIVSDLALAVARKIFFAGAVSGANVAQRNPSSFVREIIAATGGPRRRTAGASEPQ